MKRLLLSLLFIATGVMAQSMPGPNPPPGSNDIYIDQVGNGANINITQDGSGNWVGGMPWNGNGSRGWNYGYYGDQNKAQISGAQTVNIQQIGSGGEAHLDLQGGANTVNINQYGGGYKNTQVTVNGGGNTVNTTVNAGYSNNFINVQGNNNSVTANQGSSTIGLDTIGTTINVNGTGNTASINLNQAGGGFISQGNKNDGLNGYINYQGFSNASDFAPGSTCVGCTVTQSNGSSAIWQEGISQTVTIADTGLNNGYTIAQSGNTNTATLAFSGNDNTVKIEQSNRGAINITNITSSGNSGTYNIIQRGH
jgi:Curlin associated repeat